MITRSLALLLAVFAGASAHAAGIPIKVVIVALYESDSTPGEFHHWVERDHLDHVYPFPQGFHDLRTNDQGVLGILTGVGTARAAASIMALGLDPRFDLTKAYWLVAGIAGGDPQDASLGSAVWAQWVVDGDLAFEVDAREIPPQWSTGYVPLGKKVPYEQPRSGEMTAVFHLNPALQVWAYEQTKAVKLDDSPELQSARSHFAGANAHRPPFVLKGDVLASSTFWHGKRLDQWANDWVNYQTDSKGNFVTSSMEDSGILQSLSFLHQAGRVDLDRVMVLRTVSNYDQPATGSTAAESLAANAEHRYSAYFPALEAAYRVGNAVVSNIVTNWDRYRDQIPGTQAGNQP
ncbi:MAG: purine nucleoside permease [Acidobacteriaceae bacterium]